MIGLELLQLAQQLIELSVADLGLVRDVVPLFVMANLATEFLNSRGWVHLTIAGNDVIGKEHQRVTCVRRGEAVERLLGALDVV